MYINIQINIYLSIQIDVPLQDVIEADDGSIPGGFLHGVVDSVRGTIAADKVGSISTPLVRVVCRRAICTNLLQYSIRFAIMNRKKNK